MAEQQQSTSTQGGSKESTSTKAKAAGKSAQSSAHSQGGEYVEADQAYEKGWFGARPQVHDDEEYALTSGPDSPGANPDPDNPGKFLTPTTETEEVP